MATTSQKLAESGFLHIVAIGHSTSSPIAPGVPPITSAYPSFKEFDGVTPLSTIVLPKGVDSATRQYLSELTREYLSEPATVEFFGKQGAVPVPSMPEDAKRTLYEQETLWVDTILRLGIQNQSR
jgi:tripartite-type tricarboxylate transporter receptor subunit TctC